MRRFSTWLAAAAGLTRAAKPPGMTKTDGSAAGDTIIEWKCLQKATGKSRKDLRI